MREECVRRGYDLVFTPHIMRRELWKISGHEGYYAENMYPPMELDDAEYRLKPMNCPGHILIYKSSPRSYRDLPQRYAELGNVYRYERSGTMHGLLRVRGFTQDDAHIFCTPGQIEDEVVACIDFAQSVLKTFGFSEFKVELSTWDPAKAEGLHRRGRALEPGHRLAAARAGAPRDSLPRHSRRGRVLRAEDRHQAGGCAGPHVAALHRAVRLQPARALRAGVQGRGRRAASAGDGASRALRFCRAILRRADRALRRGVSALARAGAGRAGAHLAARSTWPTRSSVKARLEAAGLRVELDARNEKMNAKIRDFGLQKVPFILILGDKEAASSSVSVRTRGKGDQGSATLDEFVARAQKLVADKGTEL